ncbi:MAG: NAD-binding protein [Candidatus Eremiobacteraeota bacterium]|nr:NAD-binding protein [Candidatus Eremiobacteraeota bacterium]
MTAVPLILVVGGDDLAVRVCEELCATQGHRAALVWSHDHHIASRIERLNCDYFPYAPNDVDALRIAGVCEASSIMVLSDDDRLNLQVALKARDLNPHIRVVLRQFNRTLGRKIEQNLPDCSVLSLSAHSAASFVAAALDPACFFALQFPDRDGVQAGFSERTAGELAISGLTLRTAQAKLGMRIVALEGSPTLPPDRPFRSEDRLVVFARTQRLDATAERPNARADRRHRHLLRLWIGTTRQLRRAARVDPILARIALAIAAIVLFSVVFFAFALPDVHHDPVTALYFVLTTFSTTGYGDITPRETGVAPFAMLLANLVMLTGVVTSGIFIAIVTSALTRAQFTLMQGLRQIRTRDHVLVCGAGNVGTRVLEFLMTLGHRIVVVETAPDPRLVELSRSRRLELLTADATRDSTLDMCNLANARAVVAVTQSETANLEIALGARARNAELPVVMRVADDAFAASISRQFSEIKTISTTALAAPTFAMLSRFPGTRGRIAFGDDTYNVGERQQGEVPAPPPADHCIALAVWRRGEFLHIDSFDEMQPFDRLLFIVPLSQFKPAAHVEQREALAAETVS